MQVAASNLSSGQCSSGRSAWMEGFVHSLRTIAQKHASTLELLRPPTRFSILSEQTLITLTNP